MAPAPGAEVVAGAVNGLDGEADDENIQAPVPAKKNIINKLKLTTTKRNIILRDGQSILTGICGNYGCSTPKVTASGHGILLIKAVKSKGGMILKCIGVITAPTLLNL